MTVAESISDQAAKDSVTSELVSSLAALWCNGIPASSSFFPFLFFVFTWKTYTVCWSENTTRKQIVQIMDWMKSSKASFFKHMHISISEHANGACPEGVIIVRGTLGDLLTLGFWNRWTSETRWTQLSAPMWPLTAALADERRSVTSPLKRTEPPWR